MNETWNNNHDNRTVHIIIMLIAAVLQTDSRPNCKYQILQVITILIITKIINVSVLILLIIIIIITQLINVSVQN